MSVTVVDLLSMAHDELDELFRGLTGRSDSGRRG